MRTLACLFLLLSLSSFAQTVDTLKHFTAKRVAVAPKIDGFLSDSIWQESNVMTDFIQRLPIEKTAPTQKSEVRIIYDDLAVYVGAMLYDTHPDSILHELGSRDSWDLNADEFEIFFDTYHSNQDAFSFRVTASGVQGETKMSDYTYNAVWHSHVKILENGWSVEMRIPYSALRFPKKDIQDWGLQVARTIRRNRERDQWSYIPSGVVAFQKYFGTLHGIEKVVPPVRLSISPYASAYYESAPDLNSNGEVSYVGTYSYNVGTDIKYGINESFTLDMILFPDFGQVASDNKVKNLGYREITYGENREFFKEGTELFNKNQMFYSRRIGKTPSLFYSLPYMIDSTDKIIKNPSKTNLLNAFKLSGRTENKLGIGILNAVTSEMNALVEDSVGNRRKILTEPLTNYNIVVFDQQLKNNSSVYFYNTNVMRSGEWSDANVSAAGIYLENKKNSVSFRSNLGITQKYTADSVVNMATVKYGNAGDIGIRKIGGNWEYGVGYGFQTKSYDPSDLGYQQFGDFGVVSGQIYHGTYKPGKVFRNTSSDINFEYAYNLTTGKPTQQSFGLFFFGSLLNYFSIYGGGGMAPWSSYDYYEPRVEGLVYRAPQWAFTHLGISTDYRKKFALDGGVNYATFLPGNVHDFKSSPEFGFNVAPRYRFNDKLTVTYRFSRNSDAFNPGFACFDSLGDPVFGGRELHTVTNNLTIRYTFKNDMQLFISGYHYWTTGEYLNYYHLTSEGLLTPYDNFTTNNDFSFTSFNLDASFSWQFAPGSNLSIVYKNSVFDDAIGTNILPSYFDYLGKTFDSPQTNTISIKAYFYLDYNEIKRKKKKV